MGAAVSNIANLSQVNSIVTTTTGTLWAATGNFVIILALLGVLFLFSRYVGRGPFVALLLAFYAAYALYETFPYMSYLPTAPAVTALVTHAAVYVALVLVFYMILRRVVVSDFLYIGLFGLVALSFFGAAFLVAISYHLFLISAVYQFNPTISAVFAPDQYFFWWFAAPAIGLFFLAR
ncbi:MAG TPA: hypothetical protein VMV50_00020 [Candidatus Paceibacterota bacterium]|nr:hypothetical protein [Candidatus Paceibacterota bacterium]